MTGIADFALQTLNFEPIDNDHLSFVTLIEELREADNVAFVTLFEALLKHTEQHFAFENQLMEKYQFAAIHEHQGEHRRVLGELTQFKQRVDRGQIMFARAFCNENLKAWFDLHVASMDSALVAHIKSKQD